MTIRQIQTLRTESGAAGDLVQVHICSVALDEQDPVTTADQWEERYGGGGFSARERAKIMAVATQEQAWAECARVIADAAAQG